MSLWVAHTWRAPLRPGWGRCRYWPAGVAERGPAGPVTGCGRRYARCAVHRYGGQFHSDGTVRAVDQHRMMSSLSPPGGSPSIVQSVQVPSGRRCLWDRPAASVETSSGVDVQAAEVVGGGDDVAEKSLSPAEGSRASSWRRGLLACGGRRLCRRRCWRRRRRRSARRRGGTPHMSMKPHASLGESASVGASGGTPRACEPERCRRVVVVERQIPGSAIGQDVPMPGDVGDDPYPTPRPAGFAGTSPGLSVPPAFFCRMRNTVAPALARPAGSNPERRYRCCRHGRARP